MNQKRIFIGTSGFSYPEWKGSFYPKELSPKKYLPFYAERFHTTEINNTFYRIPTAKNMEEWYAAVPADFSFTLKLNQNITHRKRLKEAGQDMERFLNAAASLKEKLGTILVQLPPYFKADLPLLEDFLSAYSKKARLAFEFRHDTWLVEDVYQLLRNHNCALGVVEAEDRPAVKLLTADFVYLRLRKGDYNKEELAVWAEWIHNQKVDVYCYLKHDEKAPLLAQQLLDLLQIDSADKANLSIGL